MRRSISFHERRRHADGWLLWLVVLFAALVLALTMATTAAAGTIYDWDNWSGNSEFHDANNWRPGGRTAGSL